MADVKELSVAKQYDLTPSLSNFLDRHLLYQILENLAGNLYNENEIDNLEFNLLKDTYMIKILKEIFSSIKPNEKFPVELEEKEKEIVNELHKLNKSTDKTFEILRSDEIQNNPKNNDKTLIIKILNEKFNINDEKILELFNFGKLLFNTGEYEMSSDLLNNFKILSLDNDLIFKSTLGKFICDIMNHDFVEAKNEFNQIRDIVDNRYFQGSLLDQLKLRNWLIHNSLFMFFNGDESTDNLLVQMNEIFLSSSYISTIEASCPWILRYIIVSIIFKKDFKKLKDLLNAIKIEAYEYNDPFTLILKNLFIDIDLSSIKETIENIKTISKYDFFIKNLNFNKFFKNLLDVVLKNLFKIYKSLSIELINEKFIDSSNNGIITEILSSKDYVKDDDKYSLNADLNHDIYFQTYEKTKALSFKSNQFLNNAVHI